MAGWHNYLKQYFSAGFNKGCTYDMVQLLELSGVIRDGVLPGFQQPLQTVGCPLSVLCHACQACIYFGYISEMEVDAVFWQPKRAHSLIWNMPPKCLLVIQ